MYSSCLIHSVPSTSELTHCSRHKLTKRRLSTDGCTSEHIVNDMLSSVQNQVKGARSAEARQLGRLSEKGECGGRLGQESRFVSGPGRDRQSLTNHSTPPRFLLQCPADPPRSTTHPHRSLRPASPTLPRPLRRSADRTEGHRASGCSPARQRSAGPARPFARGCCRHIRLCGDQRAGFGVGDAARRTGGWRERAGGARCLDRGD